MGISPSSVSQSGVTARLELSGSTVTVNVSSTSSYWRINGTNSGGDHGTYYINENKNSSGSFTAEDNHKYAFQVISGGTWSDGAIFTVEFDYTFRINQGTGASITCSLSNGSTVSKGDTFTVTAGQTTGYNKTTFTVTGATLVSGTEDTYKVTGNVIITASATVQSFGLTTNSDENSTITVKRTKSPLQNAGTGSLNSGATIYYNDELQISFDPSVGYNLSTCTVNGDAFDNGATYTVTGDTEVVSSTTVKCYNLILNPDTGTEITVYRTSSPLQGAENTSWLSTKQMVYENVIYHSDVLEIEFDSGPEYEITTKLVNQKDFSSGDEYTVTGEVEVVTIAGLSGLANIYNGSQFDKYLIYIYNGSTWDQYMPYVYDGTKWNICS